MSLLCSTECRPVESMRAPSTVKVEAVLPKEAVRYLEPDENAAWDQLVDASPQGSVFCRSWWLKAVGGETRVLGYFESGKLVAGIPLYFETKFGLTLCRMPMLTQTLGPVLPPLEGKKVKMASREMEILKALATNIATQRFFFQSFSASLRNWLPFYWKGFRQTSRFTYVLDDLSDSNQVWKGMSHNVRGEIRKALRLGLTVSPCDVDVVYDAVIQTFARQRRNPPYSRKYLKSLCSAACANKGGQCFAAQDQDGRVYDASFLVWDRKRSFWIAGGADPKLRTSGATSLMVWHLIQFTAQHSGIFDFEGSVMPSIEHFFRGFGGKQVSYHCIVKFPLWMRAILILQGRL